MDSTSSCSIPPWLDRTMFWVRCIGSLVLVILCAILVFYAIITRVSGFFVQVPWYGQLIILIVFFFFLGILEGMQICVIELMKQDFEVYRDKFPRAHNTVRLGLRPQGLEKFLMGRQVVVLLLCFFLARLTTVEHTGVFNVEFEDAFFTTGLAGALLTTVVAQLVPRVIAINYPVHFINFFVVK